MHDSSSLKINEITLPAFRTILARYPQHIPSSLVGLDVFRSETLPAQLQQRVQSKGHGDGDGLDEREDRPQPSGRLTGAGKARKKNGAAKGTGVAQKRKREDGVHMNEDELVKLVEWKLYVKISSVSVSSHGGDAASCREGAVGKGEDPDYRGCTGDDGDVNSEPSPPASFYCAEYEGSGLYDDPFDPALSEQLNAPYFHIFDDSRRCIDPKAIEAYRRPETCTQSNQSDYKSRIRPDQEGQPDCFSHHSHTKRHGTFRPTLLSLVSSNPPTTVRDITGKVFTKYITSSSSTTKEAGTDIPSLVSDLTALKGVGPATASLVLSALDPQRVPFFGDELFRWAMWDAPPGKGGTSGWKRKIGYTAKEYAALVDVIEGARARLEREEEDVSAADVERVAFVLGKEAADLEPEVLEEKQQQAGSAKKVVKGKRRMSQAETAADAGSEVVDSESDHHDKRRRKG